MFDIAVIGLGMIGSAALRYLSQPPAGLSVAGIGPAEPADWASHHGAFASHYDRARITRITDPDPIWAGLAQRAIGSYHAIEQASDVKFHYPVGHLRLGPPAGADDASLDTIAELGQALGAPLERLGAADLNARFAYLRFPPAADGLYERGAAGFIDPRALVAAQLAIGAAQGATIVREEAAAIARGGAGFAIRTSSGRAIEARRVLVSAHGYTNSLLRPLLGRELDLVNMAHTTVYAELAAEQVERLAGMPALIWPLNGNPTLKSVYTTPPIEYPNGRVYLKIGGPLFTHPTLESPDQMLEWFRSPGNPAEIAALQSALLDLIPGLNVISWSSKPCMNTYTPHDHPFVDQLDDDLFVCTGGCGSGAKSSDEIGRIGALLAQHGAWAYDMPAGAFQAAWRA